MNFKMVSFASNFEDVLLGRAFAGRASGFYIDVGAFEPVDHSVTHHFYAQGWNGINIEPNPAPFAKLQSGRGRDINLNLGLSNRVGELTVYEAPDACWSVDRSLLQGWFGAGRDQIVARTVPVTTLSEVCRDHVPTGVTIDFLKIDVEGHEREVVEGGDWIAWRPRVVLIEANRPETWEPLLLKARYHFAIFDGVNRFYVRDEDRHLLPILGVPANNSDAFLIYGYLKRINELESRVAEYERLGPTALGLARRLHHASKLHPHLGSVVRPFLRLLAG